jgi:hypothetical protein
MKVINPDTRIDTRHFLSNWFIDKKKKAEAAIMAIQPTKKVNPT